MTEDEKDKAVALVSMITFSSVKWAHMDNMCNCSPDDIIPVSFYFQIRKSERRQTKIDWCENCNRLVGFDHRANWIS